LLSTKKYHQTLLRRSSKSAPAKSRVSIDQNTHRFAGGCFVAHICIAWGWLYSESMRSEVEFSHEDEPVDYRSLHQLYVDINRSTSSPDFNRALVKYLAAEYCISDQDSLSRAVFSMLEHQPTPTRRDYELRPAQAR